MTLRELFEEAEKLGFADFEVLVQYSGGSAAVSFYELNDETKEVELFS